MWPLPTNKTTTTADDKNGDEEKRKSRESVGKNGDPAEMTEEELDANPLLRRAAESGKNVVCWRLEVEDTGPGSEFSSLSH